MTTKQNKFLTALLCGTVLTAASSLIWDLFSYGGESGAEGRATDGTNLTANDAGFISGSTITTPLTDPVGGASAGPYKTMWPTFAIEWKLLTGRNSLFVDCATGSTYVLEAGGAANVNWSANGNLRGAMISATNTAIAAVQSSGSKTLGDIYCLIDLGRNDAAKLAVPTAGYDATTLREGFESLYNALDAGISNLKAIGVFRTGDRKDRSLSSSYHTVRQAQEQACANVTKARIISRSGFSYPDDALARHQDSDHYNFAGTQSQAITAARELALATETPQASAPSILAYQVVNDANMTTATTMSATHSTAVGTKFVALQFSFVAVGSSSNLTMSATFDGVAMSRLITTEIGASNTLTRAETITFYIDEATYGGSLSNLSNKSVVATIQLGREFLNGVIYNIDSDCIISVNSSAVISGATGSSLAIAFSTGANVAVMAMCSYAATSAVALSASADILTEIQDNSLSNGTNAAGVISLYGSLTDSYNTGTLTFSSTVKAASLLITCVRKKVNGE